MTGTDESTLRKSVGEEVGEPAFVAWLESQREAAGEADGLNDPPS